MADKKVRIDKWLWSVRLFKSRSKATDACKSGRVKSGENSLKASSLVQQGQIIELRKDGFNLIFQINELINRRVSAVLAAPCYTNLTPEAELNKFKDWFVGKGPTEFRPKGEGRPTKRARREIDSFKDELFFDEWFEDNN
jgi:ribosome-associated heat shock protein Hsp15